MVRTLRPATLVFCALMLACFPTALAHVIEPTGTLTVEIGRRFTLSVLPSNSGDSCTVAAEVTVDEPDVVSGGGKKTAASPSFIMEALKPGTAVITISFDGVGEECDSVETRYLTVTVEGPPDYAETTVIDFTARKGKDPGRRYGVDWDLDGVKVQTGTWKENGRKNRCGVFHGGKEPGCGHGRVPGRMIGRGRIQGRFMVDPAQLKGILPTTHAAVRAARDFVPGETPEVFWGVGVRWGATALEVFSFSHLGEGTRDSLDGTSVDVAVEFADGYVSFQHRGLGAASWTEFDRLDLADLPDDVIFTFGVDGLGPKGLLCVDDVVATHAQVGPAEKALCAMLGGAIALEQKALEEIQKGDFVAAEKYLSDAVTMLIQEIVAKLATARPDGPGIENPDDPGGPKVHVANETKLKKAINLCIGASSGDNRVKKHLKNGRTTKAVRRLNRAITQKLMASCWLHGLAIKNAKDLPVSWRKHF